MENTLKELLLLTSGLRCSDNAAVKEVADEIEKRLINLQEAIDKQTNNSHNK